jgi:peptide-methionine (S)-S-oxide reductase
MTRPRAVAVLAATLLLGVAACRRGEVPGERSDMPAKDTTPAPATTKLATFGGGCFWCVEALFDRLEGVLSVESGYAGGSTPSPTYKQVCSGSTGHAEVVQVRYDPAKVSYDQLLEVFWKTHDPTTPNRQGADVGTQYRSIILVHDDEQRRVAEDLRRRLEEAKVFDAPIVTEIAPYDRFWPAEDYHQGYFDGNPGQPYCRVVIAPKVEKLEKVFRDRLKRQP